MAELHLARAVAEGITPEENSPGVVTGGYKVCSRPRKGTITRLIIIENGHISSGLHIEKQPITPQIVIEKALITTEINIKKALIRARINIKPGYKQGSCAGKATEENRWEVLNTWTASQRHGTGPGQLPPV